MTAKTPITIDSSVFVSRAIPTETHHSNSLKFFQKLKTNQQTNVLLPISVALEVDQTLTKSSCPIPEFLYNNNSFIQWIPLDHDFITHYWLTRTKTPLKTADAVIVATAQKHQSILVTWDRRIITHARKIITALTPAQFLKSPDASH